MELCVSSWLKCCPAPSSTLGNALFPQTLKIDSWTGGPESQICQQNPRHEKTLSILAFPMFFITKFFPTPLSSRHALPYLSFASNVLMGVFSLVLNLLWLFLLQLSFGFSFHFIIVEFHYSTLEQCLCSSKWLVPASTFWVMRLNTIFRCHLLHTIFPSQTTHLSRF